MSEQRILVTGGTGYLGSHVVVAALQAGYRVRTTVRDLEREPTVRAMVAEGGAEAGERLEVMAANLQGDEGWPEAAADCAYVIHVASPTLQTLPKTEDEMIVPAVEGALRVLRAARDAGVKRVVLTSAIGAVAFGQPPRSTPFTEEDWTNLDGTIGVQPYQKSKTLAERAAWDFVASEGRGMQLSVVNPVGVIGPVLGKDFSPSIRSIHTMLNGGMAGCPKLTFPYVDVRDVADLHLRAVVEPAAAGERFIAAASGDPISILDIARTLRGHLGEAASRVPTREIPNWLVRLSARRNPAARAILWQLGTTTRVSNAKARRVLGWSPRPIADSIVETGTSLIRHGLVGDRT